MSETFNLPELPTIADELTRITYGKIPYRGKTTQKLIDYYAKRQERHIATATNAYDSDTYFTHNTPIADNERYYKTQALLYAKLTGDYNGKYSVGYYTNEDAEAVLYRYGIPLPENAKAYYQSTAVSKLGKNTLYVEYTASVHVKDKDSELSLTKYTVTVPIPENDLHTVYKPTYYPIIVTDGKRLYNYAVKVIAVNGDTAIVAISPNDNSYGYEIARKTTNGVITVSNTLTKELQSELHEYLKSNKP